MEKEKIRQHIHNARGWLDRAEEWLEQNNVLRALSTLFLAGAEIQIPLREKGTASAQVHKASFPWKALAAAASLFLVIAFGSTWYLASQHPSERMGALPEEDESPAEDDVQTEQGQDEEVAKKPDPASVQEIESHGEAEVAAKAPKAQPKAAKSRPRAPRAKRPRLLASPQPAAKAITVTDLPKERRETPATSPSPAPAAEKPRAKATVDVDVIDLMATAEAALKGQGQ